MSQKRNYNIDFLRGIATLWIIVIHTAWWSGTIYLPSWFSNLTLLIDVPVFMFISGISFNYVNSIIKNLRSLLNQWKKWLYFLIFYTILILIFYRDNFVLKDLLSWIVYIFPHSDSIEVVGGSIWFMIMYIKVTIICSIIICGINLFSKEDKLKNLLTILCLMLFIFIYCSNNNNFIVFDSYTSFYSLIYVLGYVLHHYKLKNIKQLITLEILNFLIILVIFYVLGLSIPSIQTIKFPPSLPYLFFSLFSILIFWYLKDNLKIKKSNVINYIGRNAIFFYYAQGISSSFLYYIYNFIPFKLPYLLFLIMLLINLICTTIGALFLDKSFQLLSNRLTCQCIKSKFLPINKKEKVV